MNADTRGLWLGVFIALSLIGGLGTTLVMLAMGASMLAAVPAGAGAVIALIPLFVLLYHFMKNK